MSAFAISAVAPGLIQFGLAETRPTTINQHLKAPNACAVYGHEHRCGYNVECEKHDGLADILSLPNMPVLMAVNFLVMMGFSFFYVAFPIHAVQGPVLAWASARYSDRSLMMVGGVILGLGFVALLSVRVEIIYTGGVLIALGNGLMWPTFMAALSKSAGAGAAGFYRPVATEGG